MLLLIMKRSGYEMNDVREVEPLRVALRENFGAG